MYFMIEHSIKLLADFISQIETLPTKFLFISQRALHAARVISQFRSAELFHFFVAANAATKNHLYWTPGEKSLLRVCSSELLKRL